MSLMRKPVMEVIRFSAEDVIVASGGRERRMATSFSLSGVNGGGYAGDGKATYNDVDYNLNSVDAVDTFIGAMGVTNAGISNGKNLQSLSRTLYKEANFGVSGNWDGDYVYDPNAIWNNGKRDYSGVFYRQQ